MVPYSDHSSYAELMDMVTQLAPRQLEPIVQKLPKQSVKLDMTVYSHLLSLPLPEPRQVPDAIVKLMSLGAPTLFRRPRRQVPLRPNPAPRLSSTKGVVFTPVEDNVTSPYRPPRSPDATVDSSKQTITAESQNSQPNSHAQDSSSPVEPSKTDKNENILDDLVEQMISIVKEAADQGNGSIEECPESFSPRSRECSFLFEMHQDKDVIWQHLVDLVPDMIKSQFVHLERQETTTENVVDIAKQQIKICNVLMDIADLS